MITQRLSPFMALMADIANGSQDSFLAGRALAFMINHKWRIPAGPFPLHPLRHKYLEDSRRSLECGIEEERKQQRVRSVTASPTPISPCERNQILPQGGQK